MLRIHSLRLKNFMLYRELFLSFKGKDVIGIIAEYSSNKDRSNRGGKTTIIEAIKYALDGTSRAESEVDLIHHGADEMSVELVLFDDETKEKHNIVRGRNRKNSSLFEVNRIQKVAEAQAEIVNLIGFSKSEFELTCFFKQQEINQFMEMSPREKQKHLMQWFKNEHWIALERDVLDDIKKLQKRLIEREAKSRTLVSQLPDEKQMAEDLKDYEEKRVVLLEKHQELTNEIEKLKTRTMSKGEVSGLKKEITNYKELVDATTDRLQDVIGERKNIKKMKLLQSEIRDTLSKLPKYSPELYEKVLEDVQSRKSLLDIVKEKIRSSKSLTGTCPILNKSCDRVAYDAKAVQKWMESGEQLAAEVNKMETILYKLGIARKNEEALASSLKAMGMIRTDSPKLLRADLDRYVGILKAKREQLKSQTSDDSKDLIEKLVDETWNIGKNIEKLTLNIGILKVAKKNAVKLKKGIDTLSEKILKTKSSISTLRYCAFMFGKSGIPSQEIENAFDEIEDETNFILQKFGTNLVVQFNPDREIKAWEDLCVSCGWTYPKGKHSKVCEDCGSERQRKRKDELTIKVLENGEEQNFQMESGGGKTLVSFSNRLALTRLIQRRTGSKFNVLFLDEPDSALDKPNKAAFMDLISRTLIREFGISQIFWITHSKEIQESIPNVLKVTRHKKHSTAAWL